MKIRNGFVSNSSSSSFICNSTLSLDEVEGKLRSLLKTHNALMDINLRFQDVFEPPFRVKNDERSIKYKKFISNWISDKYYRFVPGAKSADDLHGKLIINSVDDNTIPYELFDSIESAFHGHRIHLG